MNLTATYFRLDPYKHHWKQDNKIYHLMGECKFFSCLKQDRRASSVLIAYIFLPPTVNYSGFFTILR